MLTFLVDLLRNMGNFIAKMRQFTYISMWDKSIYYINNDVKEIKMLLLVLPLQVLQLKNLAKLWPI